MCHHLCYKYYKHKLHDNKHKRYNVTYLSSSRNFLTFLYQSLFVKCYKISHYFSLLEDSFHVTCILFFIQKRTYNILCIINTESFKKNTLLHTFILFLIHTWMHNLFLIFYVLVVKVICEVDFMAFLYWNC